MADNDIKTALENNAEGPKKATGDQGSVEQHSLKDMIEADRYLKSTSAVTNKAKGFGISIARIKAPGAQ